MALPPSIAALAARYKALPRQQQLVVLFGLPAALFLGFAYLTYDVAGKLGKDEGVPAILTRPGGKWQEIRDVEDQIRAKDDIIKERPKYEKELASLKDDIAMAEERLPREAEKASMREIIERLAREIPADVGTVQLKSVRILEATDDRNNKSDYRTVTYQTEILGNMNGIIKYIDSIEKNSRFMTVNSFSLRVGDITADAKNGSLAYGLHQVRMDLVTYVYSAKSKGGTP